MTEIIVFTVGILGAAAGIAWAFHATAERKESQEMDRWRQLMAALSKDDDQ